MSELVLTDANFEAEVLKSDVLVLVDFWAPWCGPCRVTSPLIEKLAGEYAGKPVKIGKINVDENQVTAEKYGVMSIPTFLFIKQGEVIDQLVGAQPEGAFREKLEALI